MKPYADRSAKKETSKAVGQFPKQTALALAVFATFAAMTPIAMAQVSIAGTSAPSSAYTVTSTLPQSAYITGTITGATISVDGTIGTFSNSGSILGSSQGVPVVVDTTSTLSSFLNSGVISGNGPYTSRTGAALAQHGSVSFLSNTGSISGNENGVSNPGTITSLLNSGLIYGGYAGISNAEIGAITTISNVTGLDGRTGTISGGNYGILNYSEIDTINNDGSIYGPYGVFNGADISTLSNTGAITGTGAAGIYNSGTITSLSNSSTGTISGVTAGIKNSGTIVALNNSGTIAVTRVSGLAISNLSSGSFGTVTNSGVIAGNILNQSTNDLHFAGGAGTTFGTLAGYSETIGFITNTFSNVNFAAGNLLLNDYVELGGTGTVSASAGILQVNNAISINGHYHQATDATLLIGVSDNTSANASGSLSDSGYGRLVVSGIATIDPGSSVTLKTTGSTYQFAAGQRFVVVDAATSVGTLSTNYNSSSLNYSVTGAPSLTATGTQTTSGNRKALVVSLTGSTGTGTGTGAGTGTGTGTGTAEGAGSTTTSSGNDVGSTSGSTSGSSPTVAATPATSFNAAATLKGLSSYSGISSAALLNLYNAGQAINLASTSTANQAGDKLSPVSQANTLRAAMSPTYDTLNVIGAHVDAQRLGAVVAQTGVASGESESSKALWGQAYGGHASQSQRNDVAGYSANFGGLLVGADKAINDQWRAGGAFSYSNTSINSSDDLSGNTTRVNGYGLFGYASYVAPKWYANFSAGAGYQNYKQTRQIDFTGFAGNANASFGGSQLVARGEVGYPLTLGAATLTPLASLSYAYMRQNGYTESGGNGAALSVDAAHATSVQSDLGAKIERAYTSHYGVLIPSVQVAWRHEYDHQKTSIAAQFAADPLGETRFTTQGATPVSDSAVLSAGLTLLRANNLSVTAQYSLQAGKGYLSQAGTVKLRQLF